MCNEIPQQNSLKALSKYLNYIESFEGHTKSNIINAIFIQLSHLIDISKDDVEYLSQALCELKVFAVIEDFMVLIESIAEMFIGKLEYYEEIVLIPEG